MADTGELYLRSRHEVMTIDEAAEFLRVHKDTVYNLAIAKKIPAKKLGGKWRFSRSALEKFIGVPVEKKAVSL